MKLIEKIRGHSKHHPFFTLEFFPPRTDDGFTNLLSRIERLSELDPLSISITWGAGGTTKEGSLQLAELVQNLHGIDTILHLTCTNMEQGSVDEALRKAKELRIQNILALRGDPPRGEEYWIPTDPRFTHAIDLVSYIKSNAEFKDDFCVGVAGYPDGHPDRDVDPQQELEYLKQKVDAGADFIITQLFYDVDNFISWAKNVRAHGINVPIIPGIMPLQSYASFTRLAKLCGTHVPQDIQSSLNAIRSDDQKVKDFGVQLAIDMIKRIVNESDVQGVHFCTLNLERSVRLILEGLNWVGGSPVISNKLIVDQPTAFELDAPSNESESKNLVINPVEATESAKTVITSTQPILDDNTKSDFTNPSTWDEFTNGRFGDSKSPAFGLQADQWNPGLGIPRSEVLSRWGHPKSEVDLKNIFLSHLHSELSSTPFSPSPLSQESLLILKHLEQLNDRGWWTLFSQPALDCVDSNDEVLGWGPSGGFVFQKAFVEFFASEDDVKELEQRIRADKTGLIDYIAANEKGEFRTNLDEGDRNAVTWGVFPGREIVQSTIIDRDSFLSFKDEVYLTWGQWASYHPPECEARLFLEKMRKEKWLVNIVHHDFKRSDALWSFLNATRN